MKTIIIAEAGVNHNGDIDLAKEMIDAASDAKADYVKFQTFKTDLLTTKKAKLANYQISKSKGTTSQYELLKRLELNEESHHILFQYAKKVGIGFASTAFDLDSIDLLKKFHLDFWKIPSGEVTNLPYLRKIGSFNQKVILSTGMSTLKDIDSALNVLLKAGTPINNIIVLHCSSEYPAPVAEVNLKAMLTIQNVFMVKVGYSDHTLGIEIPIAASALGASVIEKHFTLSRKMKGPDHKASLEPSELSRMVSAIRNVQKALGNGIKLPSESEIKNMEIVRKSIIAEKSIKKGEIFSEKNISVKRPGNGLSPMLWDEIIGQRACRDFIAGELIDL
jgi:N,N'-diacetyllegionaminate synthase